MNRVVRKVLMMQTVLLLAALPVCFGAPKPDLQENGPPPGGPPHSSPPGGLPGGRPLGPPPGGPPGSRPDSLPDAAGILAALAGLGIEADDAESVGLESVEAVPIRLADKGSVFPSGSGIRADGSTITITRPAVYVLSGSLSNGQVIVDVDGPTRIALNGASVRCRDGAPLAFFGAGKKILTLAPGTRNTLSDGATYARQYRDKTPDAALFAEAALTINGGGALAITGKNENGISCGDRLKILDGEITISAVNKGVKSVNAAIIAGGQVEVTQSEEGIEAAQVAITGGSVTVTASDDGVNAADSAHSGRSDLFIAVTGGALTVNAEGDGIDANGTLYLAGGAVTVHGPTSDHDGALDADQGILVNGGILLAAGSRGMAQPPAENSGQYTVALYFDVPQKADAVITVRDSAGKTLASYTGKKRFQSLFISLPEFVPGGVYALYEDQTLKETFTVTAGRKVSAVFLES
jgi:hypothetical protein